jgi:hypothetical protein
MATQHLYTPSNPAVLCCAVLRCAAVHAWPPNTCCAAAGTSPLIQNTQTYSSIKTPIPRGAKLPQIIVQMPVYKESLEEVIQLSYFNVKRAMDFYTAKGGRVKFIICDDGFQVSWQLRL